LDRKLKSINSGTPEVKTPKEGKTKSGNPRTLKKGNWKKR
jgi:hypothetical protein